MRCRACNELLKDKEANRKYVDWRDIPNPEERYIGLCDPCFGVFDEPDQPFPTDDGVDEYDQGDK